jgi:uncharacterized protein YcnI
MRRLLVVVATAGLLALSAVPAFAHVTVDPSSATQGASDVTLHFRVPNEEDNSTTTKVELFFPTDHPIAGVAAEPKPGWNVNVETTKLSKPIHTDDGDISDVVSKVTWDGWSIGTGQFDEFTVVAGALPDDASSLTFKAIQTYANGDVVRWIDVASGGANAEHPAPTVKLTAVTVAKKHSNKTTIAIGLGLAALIVSSIALGVAVSGKRAS